jgi:hypothetical protein
MSLFSWLQNRTSTRAPRGRARRRPAAARFRPRLEALEERWLPSPVTLTVTSLADSGAGSLRAAIQQADAGRSSDKFTINFSVTGTIDVASSLPDLNNNIAIQGPGASSLTLDEDPSFGGGNIITVDFGKTASVSGLTILGEGVACGIVNGGNLTVSACTISGGYARSLVAIGYAGGGIANFGTMTVSGCTISGNSAFGPDIGMGDGGGIYNAGYLTLSDSTVSGNTSGSFGAGIYNDRSGTLKISHSVVRDNGTWGDIYNAGTLKLSGTNDIGSIYR